MSTPCEKHASLPVVGHSACAGCEIERLKAENEMLREALELSRGTRKIDSDNHALRKKIIAIHKYQVDTLAEWYANSLNECARLRQDSMRWKWLEGKADSATWENIGYQEQMNRHLHVDAAMSKDPLADKGQ